MTPHRSAVGGRTVVTWNGQEADTSPESEPPKVERPSATPPGATSVASSPTDGTDRLQWCSIVFVRTPRGGEFQVVAVEEGGRRKVVARSEQFGLPTWSRILALHGPPDLGAPRRAHDLLVKRLVASGWRRLRTRGRWYDTAMLRARPRPEQVAQDRLLIECRRDGTAARFYAEAVDSFGNATSVAQSRPFLANPWSLGRPTDDARAAHGQLLEQLYSHGWASAGEPSSEWYAQVLQRPTR